MREALGGACSVSVNAGVRSRLARLKRGVDEGLPFSDAARVTGLFPSRFVNMLKSGEVSGDLISSLEEMATSAASVREGIVNWTNAVIFPLTVVLVGLMVAGLGVTFFQLLIMLTVGLNA